MSSGVGSPEPPRSEGPGSAGAGAGKFTEVEREEIAVQFVRVPDGLANIRRAWDELEAVVPLSGRHFYGAFDPVANDYRACVEVREEDELVPDLESGTLPGGRYLRARLRGDPPGV
jgi:hypothetical protein